MEACLEDPDLALVALQEEQGMIAQELEETFLAYDRRLRTLAERLADGDNPPSKQEMQRLQEEQAELWRLVRRAQAAGRSTAALTQELQEWRGRDPGLIQQGHPDHPLTRAEIVASELRVRGAVSAALDEVQDEDASPAWSFESDDAILREIASRERELKRLMAAAEMDPSLISEIALQNKELRELHARLRQADRRNGVTRERWKMGMPVTSR
jgi:hypothetical protein